MGAQIAFTTSGYPIVMISPRAVRPHEHHNLRHAERLTRLIARDGYIKRPLAVESDTMALLDGHHRLVAALELKLSAVPAVLVAYDDPRITLTSWREDYDVTRESVLNFALSGRLMPEKTSRHIFSPDLGEIPRPAIPSFSQAAPGVPAAPAR